MPLPDHILREIADDVYRTRGVMTEIPPFSNAYPEFSLTDAYRIVEDLRRRREADGERVVGRKIGFTNSSAWKGYGITGPIWNYLYDTTTTDLTEASSLSIGNWPNVRMETEVALGLRASPHAAMTEAELLDCVEWTALDFEVCTSVFPDWQFKVADGAATGVHIGLLLGKRHALGHDRAGWAHSLDSFSVTLSSDCGLSAEGGGSQVLGGPIKAFGCLVRELERFGGTPLAAGDVVTTGTLTVALPASPGEIWCARPSGIPFGPITVRLY